MMRALCFILKLLLVCLSTSLQAQTRDASYSPTLQKIRDTGIVSIGYREGGIPFSYIDQNYQPMGYSIDLCRYLTTQLQTYLKLPRLDIRFVAMTPATRFAHVANGNVDMECGVTTNTIERQKHVAFSTTIFLTESRLISRRNAPVLTINALRQRKVVSTMGTTSMRALNDLNEQQQFKMKLSAGRDDPDSFHQLVAGNVDVFVMDEVLLRSLVANTKNPNEYIISTERLSVEPYAIILKKHDPLFKQLIDGYLTQFFRTEQFTALYQKWFQQPIPPHGINLQLPMQRPLQKLREHPSDSGNPADYAGL